MFLVCGPLHVGLLNSIKFDLWPTAGPVRCDGVLYQWK